jgi:polysaccharide deacetylase 2 family uncharacterized protein YibQ
VPKKKSKKKTKTSPERLKLLAGFLVILLLLGIASVKYLQSPRGMVYLLDHGWSGYYDLVQEEVDGAVNETVNTLALEKTAREKRVSLKIRNKKFAYIQREFKCPRSCSLEKTNLAFTKAVKKAGAAVRTSREEEGGDKLVIDIGSRKYITHRIIVTRQSAAAYRGKDGEFESEPLIAIVIDDFGYADSDVISSFLSLEIPITISVIPFLTQSKTILSAAISHGKETLLHLPMEPETNAKSDVPVVMTSMSSGDIKRLVESYIKDMGGVKGVNNHMGSKATQDERVMEAVLTVLKKHRLFFLDSLTSPRSVAYNAAKEAGVKTARRNVFIDGDLDDPELIGARIHQLVSLAKKRGSAIGIGHPKEATLKALTNNIPYLKNSGVHVVFVSELMN